MTSLVTPEQAAICARLDVTPEPPKADQKVGLAEDLSGSPVNGLRHRAATTSGWYLWTGGTLDDRDDFFRAVHQAHVTELLPMVTPYLALPPGYRFLLAPGHEDVWFDESLLDSIG